MPRRETKKSHSRAVASEASAMQRKNRSAIPLVAILLVSGLVPLMATDAPVAASHPQIDITSTEWFDQDSNGHLDMVIVTLPAGSLNIEKIYPSDFAVGGGARATGLGVGPGANQFKLYFPESLGLDAGTRDLTAAQSTSTTMTLSHQSHDPHYRLRMCTDVGAPCKTDSAPPMLKAAYANQGSNQVSAIFSEATSKDGNPNCTGGTASTPPTGASCLVPADFCATNASGTPITISNVLPGNNGRTWTLYLGAALTAADVAVQKIGLANNTVAKLYTGSGPCASPPTPSTAPFKDVAGNDGIPANLGHTCFPNPPEAWCDWPAGAVPIGAPVPVAVHAGKGSNRVIVEFTGPVAGDTGGTPISTGSGFQVKAPPGEQPNWAVLKVEQPTAQLGSDRVQLTTVLPVPDLSNTLVIQSNSIFAPGMGGLNTPSSEWPLTDRSFPSVLSITSVNTLENVAAPAVETVDGDANGCVDAIKVTFNKNVNDTATVDVAGPTFAHTGWTVHWPQLPVPPSTRPLLQSAFTHAAKPITGGAGVSGNSNILYLPHAANDTVIFLTFPASLDPALSEINTPGSPLCHATGAPDTANSNMMQQVPRVSYCQDAITTVVVVGNSACPASSFRPTDTDGRPIRFGVEAMATSSAAPDSAFLYRIPVLDGAPPVPRIVETQDCYRPQCVAAPADGRLSLMRFNFSEPVYDSPFGGWQARVLEPCTTSGLLPTADGSYALAGGTARNYQEARGYEKGLDITSPVNPAVRGYDTGCLPDVTYTGSGVTDISGNCVLGVFNGIETRGVCPLRQIERGPRFEGTTPDIAVGATSFQHAGLAQALSPFCTVQSPVSGTCSPALTMHITSGPGADAHSITAVSGTTVTFEPPLKASTPSGGSTFLLPYAVNERDGAGPALIRLLGTIGSPFGEAELSERPCGWRGALFNAASGSRTTLTASSTDHIAGLRPGDPLLISTVGPAGQYTITAVVGNTLHFAPAAPAAVLNGTSYIRHCADPLPGDIRYLNNNQQGASQPNSVTRSTTAHKLEIGLPSPLTENDATGPNRDCVQLHPPGSIGNVPNTGVLGLTDMHSNAPHPIHPVGGALIPCRYWEVTGAPQVLEGAASSVDSNSDGYLDAIRVQIDKSIREGSRLLRRDVGPVGPDATDRVFFDLDPPYVNGQPNPNFGRISEGDYRFNPPIFVSCPADPDCNQPVDPVLDILWADLGNTSVSSTSGSPGDALESFGRDAAWIDTDGSKTVSDGDIRLVEQRGYSAGSPVSCAPSRDADCGRTQMAGYSDIGPGSLGYVWTGDIRPATPIPTLPVGRVNCSAANPDRDCGQAFTPTSFNLVAGDFAVRISPSNVPLVPNCVVTGKGAGPLLGGSPFSSCPGGVVGHPNPEGGSKPAFGDSCSGALPSDRDVIYVCFPVWYATPANQPALPIPNTGYHPQVSYTPNNVRVGGTIRAVENGMPLGGFQNMWASDGAPPVLVEAQASAGANIASLTFSEYIALAPLGEGKPTIADFAYVNANAGTSYCRSGVDALQGLAEPSTRGGIRYADDIVRGTSSYPVTVLLSGELSHDDVVGCVQNPPPASQTPARDGVRVAGTNLVEGCATPCENPRPGLAVTNPRTVPFTDKSRPTIERAEFVDASGNGVIDVVRITFSEPVNDCFSQVNNQSNPSAWPPMRTGSFPRGPVNCATPSVTGQNPDLSDPTRHYGWQRHINDFVVTVAERRLEVKYIVTGQRGESQEPCKDTYTGPADQRTSLRLYPGGDTPPAFGPMDGFNDDTIFLCLDPDRTLTSSTLGGTSDLGTGPQGFGLAFGGQLDYLVLETNCNAGLAQPTGQIFPICDVANIGPDPVHTGPANAMVSKSDEAITDAARPVAKSVATDDRDRNGKVDSVKVTFTETVDPTTFSLPDWNIDGHAITGFAHPTKPLECQARLEGVAAAASVHLCFEEVAGESTFDTDMGRAPGSGPRVSYANGGSVRDMAQVRNALRGNSTHALDGAPPTVVRLQSTAGSATTSITFSEPVDGTGGPTSLSITYNDLSYEDHAGPVTGFGGNQVVHSPGDRIAALTLNAPVAEADLAEDKVCFLPGHIKEHGGGLSLSTNCALLNGDLGDKVPPPPIARLGVNTTATTVILDWVTPDDPDVARFRVYVCAASACTMSLENIRTGTGPALSSTPAPPAVQRGQRQTYTYTPGAGTWTNDLLFTVITVDASGNFDMGPTAPARRPDVTPPGSVTGLRVASATSSSGDQVVLSWTAPPNDVGVSASGAVAGYHVFRVAGTVFAPTDAVVANRIPVANLGFSPTSMAAPGQPQQVTITGLAPGTEYSLAVLAYDFDATGQPRLATFVPDASVRATPQRLSGDLPTAPASLRAAAGSPATSAVALTWNAPSAPANIGGTVSGYRIHYSTLDLAVEANRALATQAGPTQVLYSPTAFAAAGQSQQATVTGLEDGTLYHFMVRAVDNAGGLGAPAFTSLRTAVDPNAVGNDTVRETNLGIKVSVTPGPDGQGNNITWTLPEVEAAKPIQGVQVWKCTSRDPSTCVILADLASGSQAFEDRTYHDAAGTSDDRYLVTAYYGKSPAKGYANNADEAQSIPGFGDLRPAGAGGDGLLGMPYWLWGVILLALLLLVGGGVYLAMRARPQPEAGPIAEEGREWPEDEGLPEGEGMGEDIGEAEGAEGAEGVGAEGGWPPEPMPEEAPAERKAGLTHYVTCPKCSTEFAATGPKPLTIQCPNCGVRGTLR